MAMPKKTGIIFVTMGVVLMLSALLLFVWNQQEDQRAGQEAELLLEKLRSSIETKGEKIDVGTEVYVSGNGTSEENGEVNVIEELPITEIDGYGYIGYISIFDFI